MHKIAFIACLLALALLTISLGGSLPDSRLEVSTDRPEYYRYQLVGLTARLDTTIQTMPESVAVTARFFHGDSLIEGIGRLRQVRLKYSGRDSAWHGTWAMPWNPHLGRYKSIVSIILSDSTVLKDSSYFSVRARAPRKIPDGFCVMTIESAGNMLNAKLPSPYGGARKWQNFSDWARYLGADAVFYSVGWTIEGAPGINDRNPWVKANFKVFPRLAEEAHKKGLMFGGYVGSYLLWGPRLRKLKYQYSLEAGRGSVYRNHHVDLDDAKRRADIVFAVQQLEADSNVDFIGLDYIRPGAGGFESVDSFVAAMNITTPPAWPKWNAKQRILWIAGQVKPLSKGDVHDRWQWWQAHRSASAVERIITQGGITKPVWGFTLGWDKGHEHGQDPVMMNDAGLDLDMVMLYESNAWHCQQMSGQWSSYLKGDEVQMIVGEQIDWVLLQKSIAPPAPEEFYIRLTDGIRGLAREYPVKGLFWHDMFRGIKGRKGPHPSSEWLIVGAASFTKVRDELGLMPFSARLVDLNGQLFMAINCRNSLPHIKIERLTAFSPLKTQRIDSIKTDTTVTLGKSPNRGLVAYRMTWNKNPRDQFVVFSYFPQTYQERPFRPLQSFRTGGFALVANGNDGNGLMRCRQIGHLIRMQGLDVNYVLMDSLFTDLQYKYKKIIVVTPDSMPNRLFIYWNDKLIVYGDGFSKYDSLLQKNKISRASSIDSLVKLLFK